MPLDIHNLCYFGIRDLTSSCVGVTHPEHGSWNMRRNLWAVSTRNVDKSRKPKLYCTHNLQHVLVSEEGVTKTFTCARTLIGQHVFLQLVGVEGSLSVCEVEVFTTDGRNASNPYANGQHSFCIPGPFHDDIRHRMISLEWWTGKDTKGSDHSLIREMFRLPFISRDGEILQKKKHG